MKILRTLMIIILLIAGIFHFIYPGLFLIAMPPYIPYHQPIVYFTGIVEIVLAIGLMVKKYRSLSSRILALYFVAIIPAHIHVSLNQIKMFGISSPILLWGRTAFQSVFIYWAWKLKDS